MWCWWLGVAGEECFGCLVVLVHVGDEVLDVFCVDTVLSDGVEQVEVEWCSVSHSGWVGLLR